MHTTTNHRQYPSYAPWVCIHLRRESHVVGSILIAFMASWGLVNIYVNLCWSDITCSDWGLLSIVLYQSKTDPFWHGHTFQIYKTNSSTCPHKALIHYRTMVSNANTSPDAFVFQAGRLNLLSCATITRVFTNFFQKRVSTTWNLPPTTSELVPPPQQPLLVFQHGWLKALDACIFIANHI